MSFDNAGDGTLAFNSQGGASLVVNATGQVPVNGARVGLSYGIGGDDSPFYPETLHVVGSTELAIVPKETWGWAMEYAGKAVFGDSFDTVKVGLSILYQVSGISDVGTLMDAAWKFMVGKVEEIDGFEVSFASVGLGVSITSAIVSGGTATIAAVASLQSLKAVLKELFVNGAVDIMKTVFSVTKFAGTQIREYVRNPASISADLKEFGAGLSSLLGKSEEALDALVYLLSSLKSLDDIRDWLALRRIDSADCVVGKLDVKSQPLHQRIVVGLLSGVIRTVEAAGNCLDLLHVELPNLRAQLAAADPKLSEEALGTLMRSVHKNINQLNGAGIRIQRSDTIRMFGQIAERVGTAELDKFTKRWVSWPIAPPRSWADPEFVSTLDDYMDVISRVPSSIKGYEGWLKASFNEPTVIQGAHSEALLIGRIVERLKTENSGVLPLDADFVLAKKTEIDHVKLNGMVVEEGSASVDFVVTVDRKIGLYEVKKMENYWGRLKKTRAQFLRHMETEVLPVVNNKGPGDSLPIYQFHINTVGGVDVNAEAVANDLWEHLRKTRREVFDELERAGFAFNKDNVIVFSEVLPPITDTLPK